MRYVNEAENKIMCGIYIDEDEKNLIIRRRVIEELGPKPQKFGRSETFCEAIRYHIVGPDVLRCDLLRLVKKTDIMFFEGDVSGLSGYLWCNSKVDCGLVVFQYDCWVLLWKPDVCSKLSEVLNVLGASAQGEVFRLTGAESNGRGFCGRVDNKWG